jgi:hypothetical protein
MDQAAETDGCLGERVHGIEHLAQAFGMQTHLICMIDGLFDGEDEVIHEIQLILLGGMDWMQFFFFNVTAMLESIEVARLASPATSDDF